MVTVNVRFTHISAERTIENLPPQIQFQTQLTLPSGEVDLKEDKMKIPFVFMVSTSPPVANISLKGHVIVEGANDELKKIYEDLTRKRQPPKFLISTILHNNLVETVLMSREIGVPPPIPLPQIQTGGERGKYRSTDTI